MWEEFGGEPCAQRVEEPCCIQYVFIVCLDVRIEE